MHHEKRTIAQNILLALVGTNALKLRATSFPGSLIWGGKMRDPGNELVLRDESKIRKVHWTY